MKVQWRTHKPCILNSHPPNQNWPTLLDTSLDIKDHTTNQWEMVHSHKCILHYTIGLYTDTCTRAIILYMYTCVMMLNTLSNWPMSELLPRSNENQQALFNLIKSYSPRSQIPPGQAWKGTHFANGNTSNPHFAKFHGPHYILANRKPDIKSHP